MPGQFINTGTNPDGKFLLTNVNNSGNAVFSIGVPVSPTTTTTTTSTTTTTTTNAGIVAQIAISYTWAGDNTVDIRANVISGTTLNSLSFIGDTKGYLSAGCTGTETTNTYNISINAGSPSAVVTQFAPIVGVLSAQASSLTVNGTSITGPSQTITVGGNTYLITGATNCFSKP